jgi:hemolysin activation/secretion protein
MNVFRSVLAVSIMTPLLVGGVGRADAQTAGFAAPTREELNRPIPSSPTAGGPRLKVDGGIERAPCPLANAQYDDVRFDLTSVQFNNLKSLSPELLRPAYADYVGKSVPLKVVCDIRDAAATILRQRGYLAAVQVPPQKIENGTVKLDILFAKIVALQVRGDAGKSESLIASYLEPLKQMEMFNEREAERALLLARDLPGYDVRLSLQPANGAPGEVVGVVSIERTPFVLDAYIQNFGSHSVGRFGGLVRGEMRDVLGAGDSLSASVFSTADFKEQHVLQLGYGMRVGGSGLSLQGNFTYAWTRPEAGGGNPFRSRTMIAGLEARYPLLRSQAQNVRLAGGFELVNQTVSLAGTPLNRDHLRVVYGRIEGEAVDRDSLVSVAGYTAGEPRWRVGGMLEARHGIGALNGSKPCNPTVFACLALPTLSRLDADPTAFVVRAEGDLEFRPVPNIGFSLSPRVQYSSKPLLSYEEFSAGNYSIGRGYDPGTLTGDSGAGFSAEVFFGRATPRSRDDLALQPYGFVDVAWVWNKDRPAFSAYPGQNDPLRLTSAGAGVRATYGDLGRLDVALAFPLEKAGLLTRKPDPRLLVSLTTRLLPWTRR